MRAGWKCVEAWRLRCGAVGPPGPVASTSTSTSAFGSSVATSRFSHGCGKPMSDAVFGFTTSSVVTTPATLITTCSADTSPPIGSLCTPTTSSVGGPFFRQPAHAARSASAHEARKTGRGTDGSKRRTIRRRRA